MSGWVTRSEGGFCLSCHRSIELSWRVAPDGSRVEPVAPVHVVASEPDEKDPRVTWVTLQVKCRCGGFLGIVVDVVTPDATPAAQSKPRGEAV
jgi:hypothetical protein